MNKLTVTETTPIAADGTKIASLWLQLVCAGATALALTGCAALSPSGVRTGQLYDREGTDVITDSASVQFAWVRPETSRERFCLAPAPDIALSATVSGTLGIKTVPQAAGNGSLSDSETAQVLSGRTPDLLIVREILYRACELSANVNADASEARAIYAQFLAAATQLSGPVQKTP